MAEEKKPRIDLKSRLGKKTVSAPGGPTIPPPVGMGKGGIPAPPFGSSPSQPARPQIDASNPYSAISADQSPARAEPQAIKIEMTEEVIAHQKKGRVKVVVLAGVTALIGGLIGYAFGGSLERGKSAEAAVTGAEELAKEVDDAASKIDELAEVLKSAQEKLKESKFPDEEVQKLGAIDIPFKGANLTGRGVGRFKADIVTMLITFASGSHEANESKDKIRSLLSGAKPAIEDFLAQQTTPKVRWATYIEPGPGGPWMSMQPLPEPFLVAKEKDKTYKWPEDFKLAQGGKTFTLKRYASGDPTKAKQGEPYIIPVNPSTQNTVCPSDLAVRLQRELRGLEDVLRGDKSTPGQEKDGLIDIGKVLVDKLKGVGRP
ncbi:MAG: hypothetical protein IPI67_42235 [Myxococcales bacterium]|nr:hypothetical protein [Myxococcales bacterium]